MADADGGLCHEADGVLPDLDICAFWSTSLPSSQNTCGSIPGNPLWSCAWEQPSDNEGWRWLGKPMSSQPTHQSTVTQSPREQGLSLTVVTRSGFPTLLTCFLESPPKLNTFTQILASRSTCGEAQTETDTYLTKKEARHCCDSRGGLQPCLHKYSNQLCACPCPPRCHPLIDLSVLCLSIRPVCHQLSTYLEKKKSGYTQC